MADKAIIQSMKTYWKHLICSSSKIMVTIVTGQSSTCCTLMYCKNNINRILDIVNHVRVKIKYELPSYTGSLTTVCRSDVCY